MKTTSKIPTRKKSIYVVLMGLILMVSSSRLQAQEEVSHHPLIGIWNFDYPATLRAAAGEGKAGYDTMDEEDKNRVKFFYEGRRFTFNSNGTYRMQQGDGSLRDGQWAPMPEDGEVILSDGEQRFTYRISFEGDYLKMRLEGDKGGMAMLRDWYLKSGR